jgi:methylated-DNA-[protein]-cysteine S-methyltransferase
MLYYTVFRTKWGYFGLAGNGAVRRTRLPVARPEAAEQALRKALGSADLRFDRGFLRDLQERIVAYFEGEPVDFRREPPVALEHASPFARKVLAACRRIPFGQTTTYRDLARRVGCPAAARAVGGVMAGNPVPLIVPCHRVLRTDGGLGGFSAPGGLATKQKLLDHERALSPALP